MKKPAIKLAISSIVHSKIFGSEVDLHGSRS